MPEVMKWVYRIFLESNGWVTNHTVDFNCHGEPHERYDIVGQTPSGTTITLELSINRTTGKITGRMEQRRDVVPVYEIGSCKPVEFINSVNWKNFDLDQEGHMYK